MAGYLGASPVPQTIQKKQSFTATASQTTFTTTGYTDGAFINVYLNGVRLINGTDYTATNGSDIVLTTGASASDVLDFETFNEFTLVDQTLETPTFRTSATLKNDTEEDTDGGRESTLIFKGEQSGGEISTLAEIEASHDGTADDEKGDLIFRTNDGSDGASPTERLRLDSAGTALFAEDIELVQAKNINFKHQAGGTLRAKISADSSDNLTFATGSSGTQRVKIDTNGQLGIGNGSDTTLKTLEVRGAIAISNSSSSYWVVDRDDSTGGLTFANQSDEYLQLETDGSLLISDKSNGNLTQRNNPAGWNILGCSIGGTEQGAISANTTNTHHRIGRQQDGNILQFLSAGGDEGGISISGSTVSYNGGHLSRWSRLTSNNKDASIVKGTVLTNLDEMVVWSHDAVEGREAYTEENEQLNCMAVSSVEGDANVAGVFVNWDDDDDFNDMNVAMTGDMVIRIAQVTTVARGDLLMSAGDGTAKPQGDDIVRSKTIAKVTSTNVSHTYDDGSYLVPCVLMAC